ncbi:MAG: manganese efflux pump [Erysipelotrichales bacterium]|nr:MAG: manganese efflux pump [Erysipelotrichales bacterium]
MELITLFLIAVGLSMDAFAVALVNGLCASESRIRYALRVGLFFGFFQGFMTWLGYTLGTNFSSYITSYDHWIAFILLGLIGGKMIYEGIKPKDIHCEVHQEKSWLHLCYFSIATSIDALAVGVSFAFLNISILTPSLLIGIVTFSFSALGVMIGKRFALLLDNKAEILGGVVLFLIGARILYTHLM